MSAALCQLEVLYLGGTFASFGNPLAPLETTALGDVLAQALSHAANASDSVLSGIKLNIYSPIDVCDSSQLSSTSLLQVEQALSKRSHLPCLIITGTDTLSFLASYLALSSCHPNCCVIASMDTLIDPATASFNSESFAFKSFRAALNLLMQEAGVSCVVDGESLHPLFLSKLHSRMPQAFADHWIGADYGNQALRPAIKLKSQHSKPYVTDLNCTPRIAVCFATPSHDLLIKHLSQLKTESPDALLLVGYGAGNFIYSKQIEEILKAISLNSLIMISTQVNFGGCSQDYAAGSWLGQVAISSAQLGYPASYSALLLACARCASLSERIKILNLVMVQTNTNRSFAQC